LRVRAAGVRWSKRHWHERSRSAERKSALSRNDRFILGAVVLAAVMIGLVFYNTRNHDEPTNQHGLVSAPESPAGTAGKK
jgi:hypothetical protein